MNTSDLILYNMYYNGSVRKDDMAQFKTKDITIKLERKDAQLWYTDTSYKYLCILTFIDNITQREILKLSLKETDISIIMDNFENFMGILEVSDTNLLSPMIQSSIDNTMYYFNISTRTETPYDDLYFIIYQYNPITNETIIRLKILMSIDQFSDFFDIMYFIFLIDIKEEEYNNMFSANGELL